MLYPQPTSTNAASHNELAYNLEVFVEIHEEDGRGNFSLVSTDKDCLKLRIGSKKKVVIVVSQSSRHHISLEKYVQNVLLLIWSQYGLHEIFCVTPLSFHCVGAMVC